jgi:hypothetical protein
MWIMCPIKAFSLMGYFSCLFFPPQIHSVAIIISVYLICIISSHLSDKYESRNDHCSNIPQDFTKLQKWDLFINNFFVISQVFFLNISEVSELRYHLNNRLKKKNNLYKNVPKNYFWGPGVAVHAYDPSYSGGRGGRLTTQGQPRQKPGTLSEKRLTQKGLEM